MNAAMGFKSFLIGILCNPIPAISFKASLTTPKTKPNGGMLWIYVQGCRGEDWQGWRAGDDDDLTFVFVWKKWSPAKGREFQENTKKVWGLMTQSTGNFIQFNHMQFHHKRTDHSQKVWGNSAANGFQQRKMLASTSTWGCLSSQKLGIWMGFEVAALVLVAQDTRKPENHQKPAKWIAKLRYFH